MPKSGRIKASDLADHPAEQEARRLAREAIKVNRRGKPQQTEFEAKGICRSCGSSNYRAVLKLVGEWVAGGVQPTEHDHFECLGCSTHFSNPKLFFAEI